MATVRMIAARFHFDGATPSERAAVDVASEICLDYKNSVGGSWEFGMGGVAPTEEVRAKVRRGNERYLPILESMLLNKDWLVGENMTYADVLGFETLEQVVEGGHNELWDFPNVRSFWLRVRGSQNISMYLSSPQRMTRTKEDVVMYKRAVNKTMGRYKKLLLICIM
jgi:glutathione S-transferase